ncbi:MAG: PilN domain-containing protein [Pseudomonadota bacterium]
MAYISAFFRWWFAELAGLLPASWRERSERKLTTVRFQVLPGVIEIGELTNGGMKKMAELPLGPDGRVAPEADFLRSLQTLLGRRFPVGRSAVEVGLPAGRALAREVELPLPAEENLRGVLGFEMERLTPFPVDDIYFSGQIIHRDPTKKKLDVGLLVVPKGQVDPVLGLLPSDARSALGEEANVQQEGDGHVVVFTPTHTERAGRRRTVWGMVAVNVALLIALIAVPIWQQGKVKESLSRKVRVAAASAAESSDIQNRIDSLRQEMTQIADVKAGSPPVVETLEEVARLLPDTTWLVRFEIRDGEIQLRGSSNAASGLIETLESSALLEDVRFASPVVRDGNSGRERFHLSARFVQRAVSVNDGGDG